MPAPTTNLSLKSGVPLAPLHNNHPLGIAAAEPDHIIIPPAGNTVIEPPKLTEVPLIVIALFTKPALGKPVQLVKVPLAGVPRVGVVNTGLVNVLFVSVAVAEFLVASLVLSTLFKPKFVLAVVTLFKSLRLLVAISAPDKEA